MTTAFQETLDDILEQAQDLKGTSEAQTKNSAIEPILASIGWRISRKSEVALEEELQTGNVDYALKINGESRVLIEAKPWDAKLDDHVAQISKYLTPRPKKSIRQMAVLTNGRQWRFYLPPRTKGTEKDLQWFLQLNITSGDTGEVEELFGEFLARKSISFIEDTVKVALKKESEVRSASRVKGALAEALVELTANKHLLASVLLGIVQERDILPTETQLQQFVNSDQAIIEIKKPAHKNKPTSFEFRVKTTVRRDTVSSWSDLKRKFCALIAKRHKRDFNTIALKSLGKWFRQSKPDDKPHMLIGQTGISVVDKRSEEVVRDMCNGLLAAFCYPEDALTIYITQT